MQTLKFLIPILLALAATGGCSQTSTGLAGSKSPAVVEAHDALDRNIKDGAMTQLDAQPIIRRKVDKSRFKRAPEIASSIWINSEPIKWDDLRGKVVLVDFWTFACYNCKNTLPYKRQWYEKYKDSGFVVLGVHTPELSFERDIANVKKAVRDYAIEYPVAIDTDFSNWDRFAVRAWPTWFIVDKEGFVRYSHVGEGDYQDSERVIRELLGE